MKQKSFAYSAYYTVVLLFAAGLVLLLAVGCARRSTTTSTRSENSHPVTSASQAPPAVLSSLESHAEDAYDAVNSKNWQTAKQELSSLSKDLSAVESNVQDQSVNKQNLRNSIDDLNSAIQSKDQHTALVAANDISRIYLIMVQAYKTTVPTDVGWLDYYGRELQIWSAVKDMQKLQSTAASLEKTWKNLRPEVVDRGGTNVVQRFDTLMNRLQNANTVTQYNQLAIPILDEVDNIEKVFQT